MVEFDRWKVRVDSCSRKKKETEREIAVMKKKTEALEKGSKWNKTANKKQWKVNEGCRRILVEKMRSQCKDKFSCEGVTESIQDVLKRGESGLNKWQKILKMADDTLWLVFNIFLKNPLCKDETEDKK